MLLTEKQNHGLTQFVRAALSRRPAVSISEIIGLPVVLEVSGVSLHPLSKLATEYHSFLPTDVATVHQVFSGSMSGDALLLLDDRHALMFANWLRKKNKNPGLPLSYLNVSDCEILTEIGNIVLNSYLSMLTNLNSGKIFFSVPYFQIKPLKNLVDSLIVSKNEIRYVIVINTTFRLPDNFVDGYLVLVSSVVSLSCLIRAIEESWSEVGYEYAGIKN